jgi:hypothetical protein
VLEAPRLDRQSRPDGELQDKMSIFTSHGREEVLTTIKVHRRCVHRSE